jgi:hypothetical protein
MISDFHITSLQKRFPKAFILFKEENGGNDWKDLCNWIESKGYDSRYYGISMKKIDNEI